MARPWRVQFPGAVYHVTARGNGGSEIFIDDADRFDLVGILAEATDRFKLRPFCFCFMSNHYHLFLETPEPNLSQAMHWVQTTYTVRYNKRHKRYGHLFQGRYKAILVSDESHWFALSTYIHLNPVRARLVEDPQDWEWSSYNDFAKTRQRFEWLDRDAILSSYGPNINAQRRNYRRDTMSMCGRSMEFWKDMAGEIEEASRTELRRLKSEHPPRGNISSVPEYKNADKVPDLMSEVERIARVLNIEIDYILRKRASKLRDLVWWQLVKREGFSQTRVANAFKITPQAVSAGLRRFEESMSTNPEAEILLKNINTL